MSRDAAIRWLINLRVDLGEARYVELWHYAQALDEIVELLKADVVPVIHCKDCEYWDRETVRANSNDFRMWNEAICKEHSLIGVNEPHEVWTDADWFCADGGRKA